MPIIDTESTAEPVDSNQTNTPPQQIANKYKTIKDYELGSTLGRGTFGKVKAAKHIPSGEEVAIKIINKESLKDEEDRERLNREVEIMKMLRHPNIIQLYQVIQSENYIFLVTEYAQQGQLFRLMAEEVRLGERAAGRIFIQLMNALEYVHRLGIAHRDLKPENILLDTDYNIKLIDFGLSNFVEKGTKLGTACGSPCYAPPEMVSGNTYDGKVGDVWSMGVIFYAMVCGSLPFEEKTTKQLYQKVIEGFYVIPSDISLEAIEVIRKMLVTNPEQRICIPEIRSLTFFKNLSQIQPRVIGVIVGFHPMPIDNQIFDKMAEYMPFDYQEAETQIKQNRQTPITTLYYLIQKKSLRAGQKTILDLQIFLQTHEKYKMQYGILPGQNSSKKVSEKNSSRKKLNCDENIKMRLRFNNQNRVNIKSKYKINNTKGLSKEKRPPILLLQQPNLQKEDRTLEKSVSNRKERGSLSSRIKTISCQREARRAGGQDRSLSSNKSRNEHAASESKSKRKKNLNRVKLAEKNKFALSLWNTYFQKPLESTISKHPDANWAPGKKIQTISTARKNRQKEKQNQAFNTNLNKLKNGFIMLPLMKKEKQQYEKNLKRGKK